jgi:hypothetical protein
MQLKLELKFHSPKDPHKFSVTFEVEIVIIGHHNASPASEV